VRVEASLVQIQPVAVACGRSGFYLMCLRMRLASAMAFVSPQQA
jgi:hypothetical protein